MKKNNELEQQITKYDYLFKSTYLQLEVSDSYNNASYQWKLGSPINNIIGIKLMSYSLPPARYNINSINNKLSFKINDNLINISIDQGKYSIDNLITIINEKLTENNIKFSVNHQEKIIIESNDNFDIVDTIMSKEIFGFTTEKSNNNKYISDNIWDLRIDDKIYLFLTNISDTPFGILYFNCYSDCQFKFEKPFDLEYLDILFKDSKGREYNFNNLPHSLSFLIQKI